MKWMQILFFIFLFIAFLIYTKLSQIQIRGKKLIPLKYRLLIALAFPVLLVFFFFAGVFVIGLILTILFIFLLFFLLRRRRVYFKRI